MAKTYIVQHRGGAEDKLNAYTGQIHDRELIIERSNDGYTRFKIGDGETLYVDLPYLNTVGYASVVRKITIELPAKDWQGETSPFSQVITIEGVTENSKIDLQVSAEQLNWLQQNVVSLTAVNDEGTVTIYAIGYNNLLKYMVDFTTGSRFGPIQATVSETTNK
jgi:hypothetical protein